MTNDEKRQEAVDQAKRARMPSKNVDKVADETKDAAQKLEGTVDDAVRAVRRIRPRALNGMATEIGIGVFALAVSLWAGGHAVSKFREAYDIRKFVAESATKADHHIRPSQA